MIVGHGILRPILIKPVSCIYTDSVSVRRSFSSVLKLKAHQCLSRRAKHCFLQQCSNESNTESLASDRDSSGLLGVIFDMDGVLCDSEAICRQSAADTFKLLYGVDIPESAFFPFQGMGDKVYFESVAEQYNVESFSLQQVLFSFLKVYSEKLGSRNIAFPGALDLVNSCKNAGLKIAVASSAERNKVQANIKSMGLETSSFDVVVSGDMVTKLKPNPDIFLKAAELLNLKPQNCSVIEDSLPGIRAAKAAGMACVGVTTTETESNVSSNGADKVFKDISEISISDLFESMQPMTTVNPISATDLSASVQIFLNTSVDLPGGLKTDRRSVLQILNLSLGISCIYLLASRSKLMSFITPKALANAMTSAFSRSDMRNPSSDSRVEAFKRYIAEVEKKGGGMVAEGFPNGADWLNSPPLSLERDLRGKLVLLDFWTYCCINCMHVLPDLAYIEKKFSNMPFAVVGVHSAKFDNEKDSNAIRNAVLRYDVEHPVVNDRNMVVWKQLGVNSWPTLILLSPKGQVLFSLPGEGHRQDLDDLITAGLEFYEPRGLLDNKVIPMALEKNKDEKISKSNLCYPGKVASDLFGNRVFISDSNNNRIVITTLKGEYMDEAGGNGAKLLDGRFEECCFKRPQGCCYDSQDDALYVADTENHALRKLNLRKRTVETVAGNGFQGRDYKGGSKGGQQQLSSPWDVELKGRDVFIAMAGQHQIWKYDTKSGITNAFSGNGYERNKNGNDSRSTSWAQPSGLSLPSTDGRWMFVADSESSSLRKMNLETGGSELVAGGDPLFSDNLFRFGDADGKLNQVLLQHPLSVLAANEQKVFVADSYNHKLKMVDLDSGMCQTVCGNGIAGFADGISGNAKLSEPGGIAFGSNNTLFIADTNNNLIRVFNMDSKSLQTLNLKNIPQPRVSPLESDDTVGDILPSKVIVLDNAKTMQGDININVSFARGFGFTKGAISSYVSRVTGIDKKDSAEIYPVQGRINTTGSPNAKLHYNVGQLTSVGAKLQVDCKIYYCEERKECLLEDVRIEVPLAKSLEPGESNISATIEPNANI